MGIIIGIIVLLFFGFLVFVIVAEVFRDKEVEYLGGKVEEAGGKLSLKLPEEIKEILNSIDIAAISSEIVKIVPFSSEQISDLKEILISFLKNVWFNKHTAIYRITDLNDEAEKLISTEIYNKVIKVIIDKLDSFGFNDHKIIFEKYDTKLTGYKIHTGEYSKYDKYHDTYRITLNGINKLQRLFLRKYYYVISLEADYCERGRWGEYEQFNVIVDTEEEVNLFKDQLDKAIKVGNFVYAARYLHEYHNIK
jgi:hypothetical protein